MLTRHPRLAPRTGFTLIELLVVVSVIAILAGLLIPAVQVVIAKANLANDTNNMRQVSIAMIAYSSDHNGRWPAAYAQADGSTGDRTNADGRATAVASFELLAFNNPTTVPNELFRSRANATFYPRIAASNVTDNGSSPWAAAVASDDSALPFMAYDWSVPPNAGPMRPILGTRGAELHNGKVSLVYVDGHTNTISSDLSNASSGGDEQTLDLLTGTAAAVAVTDAIVQATTPDNVFTNEGDGNGWDGIARGSVDRAFVR